MDKGTLLFEAIQDLSTTVREIKAEALQSSEYRDLTFASLQYIHTISSMHNPTLAQLAEKMGLSKPSVTIMVGKLVEKKYLCKNRSTEDRRVFNISLTQKGHRVAAAFEEAQTRVVDHVMKKLTEKEVEHLIRLLAKVS